VKAFFWENTFKTHGFVWGGAKETRPEMWGEKSPKKGAGGPFAPAFISF